MNYSYEYLPWRGVEADTFRVYDVKTKIDETGRPVSIGFPYPGSGILKVRDLEKKEFRTVNWPEKSPGLFGCDRFSSGAHKFVTITEGELDACSLYQVLRSPVVSVSSASVAARDVAVCRSWLQGFERIYLCFDNDAAGDAAKAEVARLFDFNRVYDVKLTKRKDANEYLAAGESAELRHIWWNSRKFLPEHVVSSFDEFETILSEAPQCGVSYPFPTLTDLTYGIRTGESVLITAQEGVGKTEIMHAIEHSLLKRTNDNVGAIYLEEPKKRHLEALAGIELRLPIHLPGSLVTLPERVSALKSVLQKDDRLFIYSHFGSDDPDVVLDTIRLLVTACDCKYILLDHVSMVVSGLSGEDERRALDYIATRLEMMVKELNFALIFVSHVNDQGQTRGSRYLSKVADVRIDCKRDVLHPDPITRSTIELVISKNRFSGRTGFAGHLIYDPRTGILSEVAANDNTSLEARSVQAA